MNPKLSAHAQIHGQFHYDRTPIAPPGIKVLVHVKPDKRGSWATHAVEGWYIGPALDSCRCCRVFINKTRAERITDTLVWFPGTLPMPGASTSDTIIACLHDIKEALNKPSESAGPAPVPVLDESIRETLQQLTTILHKQPTDADLPRVTKTPAGEPRVDVPLPATDANEASEKPPHPHFTRSKAQINDPTTHVAYSATVHEAVKDALSQAEATSHLPRGYACKAVHPDTGETVEYRALLDSSEGPQWQDACSDEFGRLTQGNSRVKGTETMFFIQYDDIPADRKGDITYMRLVVADRPLKANPRRVRVTVGGDRVNYPFATSTKTSTIITSKLLLNSTISTPGARFMTTDIKDFYLNNPMKRFEYMRIPLAMIPPDIVERYNLNALERNGYVHVEIRKGMYGLPQAGKIANDALKPHLAKFGHHEAPHTHGLFKHESRPIMSSLVVDDFGVQYNGKGHAEHLAQCLTEKYTCTTDWSGRNFIGLQLDWDYDKGIVDLSMPGYVAKASQRFNHAATKRQDAPHPHKEPQYGVRVQLTDEIDDSPGLNKDDKLTLQEVIGTFLHYARAIDNTMLVALGSLSSAQSKGAERTMEAMTQLLDYAATHPDAILRYHRSGMILIIHSDASYLSEPKARSRVGGFFYLGREVGEGEDPTKQPINGAIHVVSNIMTNVMASAAEAETAGLFTNAQEACPVRTTLDEMGCPQPATTIVTDNQCAEGIANDTVKQRRSKAIDMRFYWIRDRIHQGQFRILWCKGSVNLSDYFTKHFGPPHHRLVRPRYVLDKHDIDHGHWGTNIHVHRQHVRRWDRLSTCKGVLRFGLTRSLTAQPQLPTCKPVQPKHIHIQLCIQYETP